MQILRNVAFAKGIRDWLSLKRRTGNEGTGNGERRTGTGNGNGERGISKTGNL